MGKLELKNVIFPSYVKLCRIPQNPAIVPQNSTENLGENHTIVRNSAESNWTVYIHIISWMLSTFNYLYEKNIQICSRRHEGHHKKTF